MHNLTHNEDDALYTSRINDNFGELLKKIASLESQLKVFRQIDTYSRAEIDDLINRISIDNVPIVEDTTDWIVERGAIDGASDDDIVEDAANTDDVIEQ